jgi:hypothetical protein
MIHNISLTLFVVAMFLFSSVSFAQDATPVPTTEAEAPQVEAVPVEGVTLGDVTADSPAYYGQQVTLYGWLVEFVNVRSFILGEGDPLFDSQVLVINNTPEEFDWSLVAGERVQITGVVMPSFEEGGYDQVVANLINHAAPQDETTPGVQPLDFNPLTNVVADRFYNYTIIEITSVDEVMYIPPSE